MFVVLFGGFAESQSKDLKEEIDEEECAEDYGYLSDSDLEDDGGLEDDEDKKPSFKGANKSKFDSSNPFVAPGEEKVACEDDDYEECVEKGKIVRIPDVAFVT
jgi:hypothetical protein